MEDEILVHFYHMNDVSVYLSRQKGERDPYLRPFLVISVPSAGVSMFKNPKTFFVQEENAYIIY